MQAVLAVFLVTLGLAQINSSLRGWRAASLVGPSRWAGYSAGTLLLVMGAGLLPDTWRVLWWTFPATALAIGLLLVGGSFIMPPPHPDQLVAAEHAAHSGCCLVQIPDGQNLMPGFFLTPHHEAEHEGLAVCVVPGAGDHKLFFKWRLIKALLAEGLTVLVIDTPGHGDYRHRPMTYPDCLSAISSAIAFLRGQPGIKRVGLAGISLGGALSIRGVVDSQATQPPDGDLVDALVVLETPVMLSYHRTLFYREVWAAFRAPALSLLREISVKQMVQSWKSGGYRSPHTTTELIDMLNPLDNLSRLKNIPILLVYSERDIVAPPTAATAMRNAAPGADMLTSENASHVTLTLMPEVNRQVARWLRRQLSRPATSHGQDE